MLGKTQIKGITIKLIWIIKSKKNKTNKYHIAETNQKLNKQSYRNRSNTTVDIKFSTHDASPWQPSSGTTLNAKLFEN